MPEYKIKCDKCEKTGGQAFARIYFNKIDNKWKWICSVCWGKINDEK